MELGSIPSSSDDTDFQNIIHNSPTWRSAKKDSLKEKPASFLVTCLEKALNEILQSLCGGLVQEISGLPVPVAQSNATISIQIIIN